MKLQQRQKVLVASAVFALLFATIAAIVWPEPLSRAVVSAWTGTPDAPGPARTSNRPQPAVPAIVPQPPATPAQVAAARSEAGRDLLIRTISMSAEPQPGVVLLVWTLHKSSDDTDGSRTDLIKLTTNSDGYAVASNARNALELRVLGQEDQLPLNDLYFAEQYLASPLPAQLEITVLQKLSISVRITFEDGQHFQGRAGASRSGLGWSQWSEVTDGLLEVGAPQGGDIRVTAMVARPGYDRTASLTIPGETLVVGGRYDFVIAKSRALKGSLTLDMTAHTDAAAFSYTLINATRAGRVQSRLSDTPMPADRTHLVTAVPVGRYSVVVMVGDCSHMEDIEVEADADTAVRVGLTRAASATVRITDASGSPLPGGVLRIAASWHTRFPAENAVGIVAVAGLDGLATLDRLPVGLQKLQVDAEGHESATLPVSLVGGTTVRLGTVSLSAARGTIHVRAINLTVGEQYRVGCSAPGEAGGTMPGMLPVDGRITFSKLPCRAYTVYLIPANGGKAVSGTVELSADKPEAEIELDGTKLTGPPRATFK